MITERLLNPSHNLPFLVELEPEIGAKPDSNALLSWYRSKEAFLEQTLLKHGAILFRGFGINTPALFARFTRSVSRTLLDNKEENVPRTKLTSGVYTSTEYPAEYRLSMHSEYSYSHHWPARLFFCCIVAPQEGGETPIADNREVLKGLAPEIVGEFRQKKVKYLRNLHGGKGFGLAWQTAFQTDDKEVVENYCRKSAIEFCWSENGLRLSQMLDGIIEHPKTGEPVWFNQAPQFHPSDYPPDIYRSILEAYKDESELPQNVRFGDGAPMDETLLGKIRGMMEEKSVLFPWQEGDLLMLDNVLVSHGRMPFSGPRKILVAMSEN
jgi:alpha-ketoglutarate-dependent taurine dioxygenase